MPNNLCIPRISLKFRSVFFRSNVWQKKKKTAISFFVSVCTKPERLYTAPRRSVVQQTKRSYLSTAERNIAPPDVACCGIGFYSCCARCPSCLPVAAMILPPDILLALLVVAGVVDAAGLAACNCHDSMITISSSTRHAYDGFVGENLVDGCYERSRSYASSSRVGRDVYARCDGSAVATVTSSQVSVTFLFGSPDTLQDL